MKAAVVNFVLFTLGLTFVGMSIIALNQVTIMARGMSMQSISYNSSLPVESQVQTENAPDSIKKASSQASTLSKVKVIKVSRPSVPSRKSLRGSNRVKEVVLPQKKFPMRIEAHRGAGHLEPENSLKAFKRAVELGIDGVETDVWLTKDKVPVIVHGGLGGMVHFAGNVSKKIGEINSRDLHKYPLKNGEKIPTLKEVIQICKDKVRLNIEIKEFKDEVINKTIDVLQQTHMLNQVTFSSFFHSMRKKITAALKARGSRAKLNFGYLVKYPESRFPNYNDTQPGDSLNLDVNLLFKGKREECLNHLKKAQEKNMKVMFWFPIEYNTEHTYYKELLELNTDTIITNRPKEMIEYFRNQSMV